MENITSLKITTAGYSLYSLDAYVFVMTYIVPVFCLVALVGNALVLVVICREGFQKATSFVIRAYYMAFALADLGVVIFYDLPDWSGAPSSYEYINKPSDQKQYFLKDENVIFVLALKYLVCVLSPHPNLMQWPL